LSAGRKLLASVAVAVALLVACSPEKAESPQLAAPTDPPLEQLKLPGFSMEAPKGEVVFSSKSPAMGKHKINLPQESLAAHFVDEVAQNGKFVASWTSRVRTHDEWVRDNLPLYLDAAKRFIPDVRVLHQEVLDSDSWIVVIGSERAPVAFGVVNCDPDFQVEITISRYRDVKRQTGLTKKLLRSVRCEVTDENRKGLLAATRLPQGFGYVPREVGQYFRSLDGETLMLNFTMGEMPADRRVYRAAIHAMITSTVDNKVPESGLVDLTPDNRNPARKTTLSRAPLPTSGKTLYIGSLYCEPEGASVMVMWSAPKFSDALAWERLTQVNCPGGESLPTPSFESIVKAACVAGNDTACGIKN
jgi:hypothetical protein